MMASRDVVEGRVGPTVQKLRNRFFLVRHGQVIALIVPVVYASSLTLS